MPDPSLATSQHSAPSTQHSLKMPSLLSLSWGRTLIEIKMFWRIPEQVFFTFALPVLFLILFSTVFSGDIEIDKTHKIAFARYFIPGIISSGVVGTTFANLAMSISVAQHEGLLKRLAGTPLPRAAYFAGKLGMCVVLTAGQTAIMLAIGILAFGAKLPVSAERWGVFVGILILAAAVGAALGIAYTRIIRDGKAAAAMVQPPFLILQFISGVYFRYADIPTWLQTVAKFFPLYWIALGFRYAFLPDWLGQSEYGAADWGWTRPTIVLSIWLVVAFVACLKFFKWDRGQD